MATVSKMAQEVIGKDNSILSMFRVTIETPFYGNNVHNVNSLREAYDLAKIHPERL